MDVLDQVLVRYLASTGHVKQAMDKQYLDRLKAYIKENEAFYVNKKHR